MRSAADNFASGIRPRSVGAVYRQPYNSENTEEAKLKLRQESQETWPRTEHAHTELLELKHMHMPHVYGPKGNTTETQAINKGNEQTERLCTE